MGPVGYRVVDGIFCAFFCIELSLRLLAYRSHFFTMFGWGWNVLDLITVITQLVEELTFEIALARDGHLDPHSGHLLLRVMRVFRSIRVFRVMRLLRTLPQLQLLASCILHSFGAFFWSSSLLFMFVYIFSMYITQMVLFTRMDVEKEDLSFTELTEWYGTVSTSIASLIQALTGGVDWRDVVQPLFDHVSPMVGMTAICFIVFCVVSVMNIVTGTFVELAMSRATDVRTMQKASQARRLFKSLYLDNSGCITFNEIEDHLHTDEVQDYFRSIDVDVSEAKCLFTVLDMDGSGSLEFDEFLDACLRLQGPARAVDLLLFSRPLSGVF